MEKEKWEEKWVMLDVWYTFGNPFCHFQYIRLDGAIEHAKSLLESHYVSAVKVWDKKETYLYLKK